MKKESSSSRVDSSERKKKLPYDNYGSFFGPSQPVIAQRVIQESKSFIENQHLAPKLSSSHHVNKNKNKVSHGGSKSSAHNHLPKVSETKVKAQKLKDTRDYSFLLSDDAEFPAPRKEPPPRNISVRNSEPQRTEVPGRSKQPPSNGGKLVHGGREDRKPVSVPRQLHPKSGPNNKLTSTSKPNMTSARITSGDSRRHLGNNSGSGPGRPMGPKGLPSKKPGGSVVNKLSTSGIQRSVNSVPSKTPVNAVQKPLPSKAQSSIPKQSVVQRKDPRELNKPKITPKQSVAQSKPQINKPLKHNPIRPASQDYRPKKKPKRYSSDEDDAINMIRSMFNYRPDRFADEDDDDSGMEAGFDEIMKEERRSAKIARKEDEEELRLIEAEEERERKRRLAKLKKRKMADK
ncbi:protein SPT2-like protein isoform X1 [Senna tora]|uniref:Protein SPT2-like protein isoform X1 n=1 Tax=Senna tora TaxID=362788 RepID=A0A834STL8_9FABA|nr:protein SPT2-like protein isoform X1 [Senna tora]